MLIACLAVCGSILLVIGMHEAGHAYCAKIFGIPIRTIALGFGKPLLQFPGKWVLKKWPLGGYVDLDLQGRPFLIRCLILLAGALANLILAYTLFIAFFMLGYDIQPPYIKAITPNSIAAKTKLASHQHIIAINHMPTQSWQDVGMILIEHIHQSHVTITTATSKGEIHHTSLSLSSKNSALTMLANLGLVPDQSIPPHHIAGESFLKACQLSAHMLARQLVFLMILIKQLIIGALPFAYLIGPFGLFSLLSHTVWQGFSIFLSMTAQLSLAVGMVNLLPIPGLDGGSILLLCIERIRKKPLSPAFAQLLQRIMTIAGVVFLIHLTMNDLNRFLSMIRTSHESSLDAEKH